MPLTRTQGAVALKYIVTTVLNQPEDGSLMKSLAHESLDHVSDVTSLQDIDVANLRYPASDGSLSVLGAAHRGLVRAFCAFIRYRAIQSSPIGDDWTSVTPTEFDQFRTSSAYDGTIYGNTVTAFDGTVYRSLILAERSTRACNSVADLQQGIKHNTSDPNATNQRLDPLGGETSTPIMKSRHDPNESGIDSNAGETKEYHRMPVAGKALLIDPHEESQHCRASIVRVIEDCDGETADNPTRTELLCSINDDKSQEIDFLSHIESDEAEETSVLKYKRITAHEGPLIRTHADWKGSSYNVMMELENGNITSEPLAVIAAADPITCAIYAEDNDLLEVDGWKRFKAISGRQGKLLRMVNQAKLRSYHTAPKYQYGYEATQNYQHAVRLDESAGNTKWQDSTKLKMFQLDDYDTFNDYGHSGRPPGKYKIRVHRLSNSGALVDRGANGGVARTNVREEWDTLPHVILTSDANWDPTVLDDTLDDDAKKPCLDPLGGETSTPITKSRLDSNESEIDSNNGETKEYYHMRVFHPSNLVGEAFVMDPKKDVYRFRAGTVRAIEDDAWETNDNPNSGALIDRGANSGFAGADPRKSGRHVDNRGIGGPLHRALEDITAEIIVFYHDALSLLWDYQHVWKLLRPPLF